ncbi:hypothetical protein K9L27_04120 [Candidatus Gracilibacteria bacterium]|nr:hypothetical protein [Candidatus Gracilibacteria bacterium]
MKKYILLSLLLVSFPVFAADDAPLSENCIQVLQPAVNGAGQCEMFPTPCAVPDGWRKIDTCDMIAPKDFGFSPEDTDQRRRQLKTQTSNARVQAAAKKEKTTNAVGIPRIGRALFTKQRRSQTAEPVDESKSTSHFAIEGRTTPKFGTDSAYQRYRDLNIRGGFKHDLTDAEKYQQKLAERGRRPAIMGSTDANREGYLSGESFISQREDNVKDTPSSNRYWKSLSQINNQSNLAKKKARVYDGVLLRKIYRDSQAGDIGGTLK